MYWRCVESRTGWTSVLSLMKSILHRVSSIPPDRPFAISSIAALGSPLFLVKARIQAYSPALPVGAQHNYRGSWDALSTILRNDGVFGLWRGVNAAILRTAMASMPRTQ